jgi:RNA polymerase sigma-70 factor, ECF subfamily
MMTTLSDSELVAHSRQGEEDAFAELFRRHHAQSLQLAIGILRQEHDAQDAVQVAYFQAFRRLDSFRGDASFKTWITRIVVNCCLLQLREGRNRVTWVQLESQNGAQSPDLLPSSGLTPEKSAWCGEIAAAFSGAVARLPKNLRDAYTLFTISGLSLQEVATSLGLTVAATKTRLFRARAGMRMFLLPVWTRQRSSALRIGTV